MLTWGVVGPPIRVETQESGFMWLKTAGFNVSGVWLHFLTRLSGWLACGPLSAEHSNAWVWVRCWREEWWGHLSGSRLERVVSCDWKQQGLICLVSGCMLLRILCMELRLRIWHHCILCYRRTFRFLTTSAVPIMLWWSLLFSPFCWTLSNRLQILCLFLHSYHSQ
jgi:hypothetical protein